MKLYHYAPKGNNVLQEGILSFAKNPDTDLSYYFKRTGGKTTHKEICEWMEKSFKGRSRAIRAFSEPVQWTDRSIQGIKDFIDNANEFEIDVSALDKDGLIDAVYVSPSVLDIPWEDKYKYDEALKKLKGINEIDYTPIDWGVCDDKLGRRFAFVRYYLLVVKDGLIPPKYITMLK